MVNRVMPTIATKVPPALAREVRRAAKARKTTPSRLMRDAIESELSGKPTQTFGERFGHLFGVATDLPPKASQAEAYEE